MRANVRFNSASTATIRTRTTRPTCRTHRSVELNHRSQAAGRPGPAGRPRTTPCPIAVPAAKASAVPDAMNINGKNGLACLTDIDESEAACHLRPLPGLPVIRDLIVDMTQFFKQYHSIKPYLINNDPRRNGSACSRRKTARS